MYNSPIKTFTPKLKGFCGDNITKMWKWEHVFDYIEFLNIFDSETDMTVMEHKSKFCETPSNRARAMLQQIQKQEGNQIFCIFQCILEIRVNTGVPTNALSISGVYFNQQNSAAKPFCWLEYNFSLFFHLFFIILMQKHAERDYKCLT